LALLGGAGVAMVASATALGQDGTGGKGGGAGQDDHAAAIVAAFGWDAGKGEYTLPKLPYAYDALEPHLDAQTMEIHHTKHHAGYVTGLNKALAELKKSRESGDFGLVKHWSRELAFHGGGHINHCLFWQTMAPANQGGGGAPAADSRLGRAIARDFESFDAFTKHFQAAAGAVEGSGWAWLVFDHFAQRLMIQQMEKQQNLLVTSVTPLLGCDVWEHAYYLKFQNKRADFVKAWFNVINWGAVSGMYEHVAAT